MIKMLLSKYTQIFKHIEKNQWSLKSYIYNNRLETNLKVITKRLNKLKIMIDINQGDIEE